MTKIVFYNVFAAEDNALKISYTRDRSVLTMHFEGELDEYVAAEARESMEEIIKTHTFKTLILDLKKLEFMDSTGVGVIIGRYKQLKARGISGYTKNVSPSVDKIFAMSGLYELFPLLD